MNRKYIFAVDRSSSNLTDIPEHLVAGDAIRYAIHAVDGVTKAAEICGITPRAIYKWIDRGCLPRTEYTGQTSYAEQLADASRYSKRAKPFTALRLKCQASPNLNAA